MSKGVSKSGTCSATYAGISVSHLEPAAQVGGKTVARLVHQALRVYAAMQPFCSKSGLYFITGPGNEV